MFGQVQNPFVVLTRPEGRNDLLAARLMAKGFRTLALPALSIQPLETDPFALPVPHAYDLIVFVSSNAVRIYLDLLEQGDCAAKWPSATLAATVGQASAAPLYQAGYIPHANILHPGLEDPQHDSEALWAMLQPILPRLRRVLIVRGETGREWLGQQLEQAGVQVERYAIYRREPVLWSHEQYLSIRDATQSDCPLICLFTSAESVQAFHSNTEKYNLQTVWQRAVFVVIHERVASRLQSLLTVGAGTARDPVVKICSPSDDAIFQTVVSAAFPLQRR